MSEPKLCPMAFVGLAVIDNQMVGPFGMCVQEKCAWWIEAVLWGPSDNVESSKWDYIKSPGHCVALDWGKERLVEITRYGSTDEEDKARRSAIRVLEAAGKVDKANVIEHWKQTTICPCPKFPKMDCPKEAEGLCADSEDQIRALLESLPDKEKR